MSSNWITNGLKTLRIRVGNTVGAVTQQRSPPHFGAQVKEVEVPPKPKKPLTPYFRFLEQVRSQVQKENPTLKTTDLMKIVGQRWENLDEASKASYAVMPSPPPVEKAAKEEAVESAEEPPRNESSSSSSDSESDSSDSSDSSESEDVVPPEHEEAEPEVKLDKLYKAVELEVLAYEPSVLDSYQWFVIAAATHLGIKVGKCWSPPHPDKMRFALLKSAFVHKKHQVHYEVRTHHRFLTFHKLTSSTADTFLEYIERNLPEGVGLKVTRVEAKAIPDYLLKQAQQ